jgi:hypothetical protein
MLEDTRIPVAINMILTTYNAMTVAVSPKSLRSNFVFKKSQKKLYLLYVINPRKKPIKVSIIPDIT